MSHTSLARVTAVVDPQCPSGHDAVWRVQRLDVSDGRDRLDTLAEGDQGAAIGGGDPHHASRHT